MTLIDPASDAFKANAAHNRALVAKVEPQGPASYFIDLHFHPETASADTVDKLLVYFLAFMVIDFVTSLLAFSLEPRHPANKGDGWLLFHVWLQRFAYRQLFSVVLVKTLKRAMEGRAFNWDKLERTAELSHAKMGS